MKKTKIALIFLSGLFGGFLGGYVIALKLPFHEKIAEKLGMASPTKEDVKEFKKHYYIDIDSVNKSRKSSGSKNAVSTSDSARPVSDQSRKNDTREYISNIISKEYSSKSEADDDVEGELVLVDEDELIKSPEGKKKSLELKIIHLIDYAKAMGEGKSTIPLIFDTVYKTFHWDMTNQLIKDDELYKILTKEVVNDILVESSYNANGWIQPRYFYDVMNDLYIRIEAGMVNNWYTNAIPL